jgi:hypothetical protein
VFGVTVNATVATLHDLPTPSVAEAPVSPVRVLLGRYQQVLDRVDESGPVLTAPIGRRRFTRWLRVPASRRAVSLLLTVHVRARLRVLVRRSNARAALLKDCAETRRDLERLEHFRASLRPTPGVKLAAPLALVGVLLAAYVLANWIVPLDQADFLGDLTKAAIKLDAGDMVDAAAENHMDAASLLVALTVIFWSMALVMLPLVPAATVVRQLLADQPGLPQAERAGFIALRARPPHDLELGLLTEASLAASALTTGIAFALLIAPAPTELKLELALFAGWALGLAALNFAGVRVRMHGRRPNRLLRIARRLLLLQFCVLALSALAYAL